MNADYIDHMGSDLSVVNAARVSFAKKSTWEEYDSYGTEMDAYPTTKLRLSVKDQRLIGYLGREKHLSPFNHTFITLHVTAPVFVARQLVKHEYMPWNEVSGRYVTFDPKFHEHKVFRAKASDKKQGSGGPMADQRTMQMLFLRQHKGAFAAYLQALEEGLCEEQARCLLPLDLMTEWFWSGTLGAWAKMYNLRTHEGVQEETMDVAKMAGDIIAPLYPYSWKALTQ